MAAPAPISKQAPIEDAIGVQFLQAGDPAQEDERMVTFLRFLLDTAREIRAHEEAA